MSVYLPNAMGYLLSDDAVEHKKIALLWNITIATKDCPYRELTWAATCSWLAIETEIGRKYLSGIHPLMLFVLVPKLGDQQVYAIHRCYIKSCTLGETLGHANLEGMAMPDWDDNLGTVSTVPLNKSLDAVLDEYFNDADKQETEKAYWLTNNSAIFTVPASTGGVPITPGLQEEKTTCSPLKKPAEEKYHVKKSEVPKLILDPKRDIDFDEG